jgi:N-acetyl-alpha-D-muramate 1-phosphate uridylyltransferase
VSRLPVAILAGGLATRLGSLSCDTPKSLLEVAGEPFVYHQLRQLRAQGVDRVTLCLGHLGEQVIKAVGDGLAFGLEVTYSFDGAKLRGTAGAIRQALPFLGPAFFVLYGDSYLECSYAAVQQAFESTGKMALMTVFRNQGRWDSSNVEFCDGRIQNYDKVACIESMQHVDFGLGVWDRRAFNAIRKEDVCDLAGLYQEMLRQGQLTGFEVLERFYEIGSLAGLEETGKYLASRT